MKGILLHGGSGTRLRPLTYTDVKQLLPIAGKPISEYALENMIDIGIKEINIVIGSIGGEEVKRYYGDGSKWNIRITYTCGLRKYTPAIAKFDLGSRGFSTSLVILSSLISAIPN